MLLVWAFAHQLGFFWQRPTEAPRRIGWSLSLAGFLGLVPALCTVPLVAVFRRFEVRAGG